MTIKYAIVGAGAMGREHIRNIEIIDEADVVALSDTNSESLNQSLALLTKDIPTFNNHHDLINANLADAYIVATPNFTHLEILKDITKSNAHLLIEKPLCTTLQDCKEIANLTKSSRNPGREIICQIPMSTIKEIAEKKMDDLNANDIDQAAKIIAGTARSMGYKVVQTGKLSVDEKIKKATLIKPTPTEDKEDEKSYEEKTAGTNDKSEEQKK